MIVRKAVINDAESIATYLFFAMEEIVYKFIGQADPIKGRAFLLHFVPKPHNQYSYENCWVVEDDHRKVIAAANVYDGARLNELREPVLDYIHNKLHQNFHPDDETQPGEYYLDTFGVEPTLQGKGIGTKLLQFVIDEYVHRQHHTLGLLVDEDNPNAKRLYLKLGFVSVGKRSVFGKVMDHLQYKAES